MLIPCNATVTRDPSTFLCTNVTRFEIVTYDSEWLWEMTHNRSYDRGRALQDRHVVIHPKHAGNLAKTSHYRSFLSI